MHRGCCCCCFDTFSYYNHSTTANESTFLRLILLARARKKSNNTIYTFAFRIRIHTFRSYTHLPRFDLSLSLFAIAIWCFWFCCRCFYSRALARSVQFGFVSFCSLFFAIRLFPPIKRELRAELNTEHWTIETSKRKKHSEQPQHVLWTKYHKHKAVKRQQNSKNSKRKSIKTQTHTHTSHV